MATDFLSTTNLTDETHGSMQSWEDDTDAVDFTSSATKVADHSGMNGTLAPGDSVEKGSDTGVTATVVLVTTTSQGGISQGQILLQSIAGGTFASGDTVQKVGATSNNVVLNSAPDSAIASLVLFDDDGDITDTVTIIGATTNTTNYRKITVNSADRHNGTHTGGGVVINPTADNHVFQIGEDNFHLEWVRVTDWQGSSKEGVRINNDCTIEQCIFHDSSNGAADGIFIDTDNITVDIINVIIFDIKRGGIVIQSSSKTGVVLNISNCAIKECLDTIDAGIHGQYGINSGTMNCINCAAFDPVTEGQNDFGKAAGASFGSSEKNISGDGTAPGTGSLIDKTASDNFVNATPGSEDFHGKDTADMKGAGKDLSGTFNIDIDGDTRTLPWSMGVDDIPTTGGGGLILLGANNLTGGKLALNGGKL